MVATTPHDEERAAREEQRRLDKMQKGAERWREQESRTKLQEIIRDELRQPRSRYCRCGITLRTTKAQLRALGAGCTAGRWVCPTLDAIRRRMDR
jgi:hypothetical protein